VPDTNHSISSKTPISEFQFNKLLQKLEELIHRDIGPEKRDPEKERTFYAEFLETHFSEFVYGNLGVCGGAYVLADKANNQLVSIYNKDIQERLTSAYPELPFIQVPYVAYQYDKVNYTEKDIEEATKYRHLIDAMFIGARDRQILYHKERPSPEFYLHLPHNRTAEETSKLLPFEKYLSEDGLEVIYCTVGEVLFYLYAWRYLVRLAQLRGINGILKQEDAYLDYNNEGEEHDFWTKVIRIAGLPESDWEILLIKNQHNWKKFNIKDIWDELKRDIDQAPFRSELGYTFDHEYALMGLIDDKEMMTREFLALVRYTIHVAETRLGWEAYHMDQYSLPITQVEPGNTLITSDAHALSNLYIAERRLDIYMEDPERPHQNYYPRLEKLRYDYSIDECINRAIRQFLLGSISKSTRQAPISQLLSKLHQKARFPILPYFYELAASKTHFPKEHLVFCVWRTTEKDTTCDIRINNQDKKETSVTFSLLTLKPIWQVYPKVDFIKGGKSIHYMDKLSEVAYNRLFRIYTFFRFLARPVVDGGFYSGLIKKSNERTYFQDYISAFSHEVSKITDNIFEKSNIQIADLFRKNPHILEDMHKALPHEEEFEFENVKDWRIIPHPSIFKTWASLLRVWSGRRGSQLFDLPEDATLKEILDECNILSLKSYVGAHFLNDEKYETMDAIILYKKKFDQKIREEGSRKSMEYYDPKTSGLIKGIKMIKGNSDEIIFSQNTFLRLLLAVITNIYEHSAAKFFLKVRLQRTLLNEFHLEFIFVNPYEKDKDQSRPKSLGTKPVITSCLQYLKSDLVHFNFDNFKDDPLGNSSKDKWLNEVFKGLDTKQFELWETRFRIPLNNIFENTNTSISNRLLKPS